MCALLHKPFVLGYLFIAILLQLFIYFKKMILIPRGMDYGVMGLFVAAFFMSQRFLLEGSLLYRGAMLGGLGLALYGGSKILFPHQYKSLLKIPKTLDIPALFEEGEDFDAKREIFILKEDQASKRRITTALAQGPRPLFELGMALLLGAVFLYFLVN